MKKLLVSVMLAVGCSGIMFSSDDIVAVGCSKDGEVPSSSIPEGWILVSVATSDSAIATVAKGGGNIYTVAGVAGGSADIIATIQNEKQPEEKENITGGTVKVVEVKSLLPDKGTEIDDGDSNENTKTFLVPIEKTGVVTVTAEPFEKVDEVKLPDEWSLEGGTGDGKLSRTVDLATTGKTVIHAECGTSYKTTTLLLFEPAIDGRVYGESSREIKDMHKKPEPSNLIASGYVQYIGEMRDLEDTIVEKLHFKWTADKGTYTAPTEGTGEKFLKVKWDASDKEETGKISLEIKYGENVVAKPEAPIKIIRPYVVRIRFVDDTYSWWGNEEQQIHPLNENEPEYSMIAGEEKNLPVCYIRNTGIETDIDLAGSPTDDKVNKLAAKTKIYITAKANYNNIDNPFDEDYIDVDNWNLKDWLDLESENNLPDKIFGYTLFMRWNFKVMRSSGDWIIAYLQEDERYSQEIVHDSRDYLGLYTIYDETKVKINEFTISHLDYACKAAGIIPTIKSISDSIHQNLSGRFDLNNSSSNDWAVVDFGGHWDCTTLSRGMAKLVLLLGIDAEERIVYPSTDTSCLSPEHPVPKCDMKEHGREFFVVWAGGWNDFESTCYVDGYYYMGGIYEKYDSDIKVLRAWLGNDSNPPDIDDDGIFQCYTGITISPSVNTDYCRIVPCP